MNEIFGSISTDSLPTGYGDEAQISHPTGGSVGPVGLSGTDEVAGQGSVSSFGTDADMSGLPSGEYAGVLSKLKEKRKGNRADKASGRVQFEGDGGYVWDFYPGVKAVLVSGPGGTPGTPFEAGSATYTQVEKEYAATGGAGSSGSGRGGRKKKKPTAGLGREIGTGLGSFFNQAAPALVGMFGPKQSVDMNFDTGSGGSVDLAPSGPSPLVIGAVVVGSVGLLGLFAWGVSRSKG